MSTDDTSDNRGRRGFLKVAALTAISAAALGSTLKPREAAAQSVAWKQEGNNNRLLELQKHGATSSGPVTLDYFGHSAFRITTPAGLTLLFDPWRNDPSGAWGLWFPQEFPRTKVDVGLSTHAHFDHDALDRLDASVLLDRLVGTWNLADVTVTGVADKHSTDQPGWYKWIEAVKEFGADPYPPNNPGHLDNVTYLVDTGGVRTLIWGDNRHNPPDDVWDRWGRVDVLTLPVDGSEHILSYRQADDIVERLKPKVVIPAHYLAAGTSSTLSTLQTADAWVDSQKAKTRVNGPSLSLSPDSIKDYDRQFIYFGPNVVKS